ncbi:hypothetical protein K466DRAFT_613042, partial [Polyporus arcularius HHB13444]
ADGRTRVLQETDSMTTMNSLTRWKKQHEDSGYIFQKNAVLTRATIAQLRRRKVHTLFRWVKGHSGHHRNEEADKLAAIGAAKPVGDPIDLTIPPTLRVSGAKLSVMTQKMAYRAIRNLKDKHVDERPRTEANLNRITSGIQGAFGIQLSEETVWKSLRAKHVTRATSQFLWMAVHDGFMIGTHWLRTNMPADLQERATCTRCGECETMTHITMECNAIGQEIVWQLLKKLWLLTGARWHKPCW